MLLDAENDGLLQKGQNVVELTSGNTGTGLVTAVLILITLKAIVCAIKGYKFVAVMSKGNRVCEYSYRRKFY